MQAQCCLVAVNSLADAFTIFRPQPPQHEIRPIVLGKFGKTVNSTMFSNPVSRLYVVGMCILCIARSFGLLRSEEARLRFRKLVESPSAFFTLLGHAQYYNYFEVLCNISCLNYRFSCLSRR